MTPPDWRLERNPTGDIMDPAVRAARQFPWRFFFKMALIALFGSAGVLFAMVQFLRRDLPSPEKLAALETPVKTTVYDMRGRVLHVRAKDAAWQREIERSAGLIRARLDDLLGAGVVAGLDVAT